MRDEIQELRFAADKASKSDMLLKKKVDSLLGFKDRVKELETLVHAKDDRIRELKEELRKDAMFKN